MARNDDDDIERKLADAASQLDAITKELAYLVNKLKKAYGQRDDVELPSDEPEEEPDK